MSTTTTPRSPALERRKVLVGGLAAGVVWTAPAIVRLDRASGAVGSCTNTTVSWSSVTGPSGGVYTATGSNGTTSITALITPSVSTGTTPAVSISGGRIIIGMSNHQITDSWGVALSFTDSAGTVCQASTLVLDLDRNGRTLGCGTNSRFEDNLHSLTGPSIVTTRFGNLIETPTGNFVSSLNCKTTDTENLGISWTATPVTGAGFTWEAGTPPGTDATLDYQVIKVDPITCCVEPTAPGAAPGGALVERATALPALTKLDATDSD